MTPLEALASSLAGQPVRVQVEHRPATTSSAPGRITLGADLDDPHLERLAVAAHAVMLAEQVSTRIAAAGLRGDAARTLAISELRKAAEARPFEVSQPLVRALARGDRTRTWLGEPMASSWSARRAVRRRLSGHSATALSFGPLGKIAARLGGGRPTSASGAGIDGAMSATSVWEENAPPASRLIVATGGSSRVVPCAVEDHVVLLPEWDLRMGRLRHDHCAVRVRPRQADTAPARPRPVELRRMQRALMPLRSGPGTTRSGTVGEDLDLDAVVRHQVDLHAGRHEGRDDRLWRGRRRDAAQVSLLTLVDHSGSATGKDEELATTARAAATWLAALGDLGISSSAFTFRSHGRWDVDLTPVVREGQRLSSRGCALLAQQERSGFTRLGAVLRYGTRRLTSRSNGSRHVVLLVSDGFPFDDDYRGRAAEADVEHALTEAADAGVGVVWVRPRRAERTAERCLSATPQVVAAEVVQRPHELTAAIFRATP